MTTRFNSASLILRASNRLQMVGPRASAIAAEMIPFQSFGRFAHEDVMGKSRGLTSPTRLNHPVTAILECSSPDHAAVSAARINLRPEPRQYRPDSAWLSHGPGYDGERGAVNPPPLVVRGAPAASVSGLETIGNATVGLHRELQSPGVMGRAVTSGAALLFYPEKDLIDANYF